MFLFTNQCFTLETPQPKKWHRVVARDSCPYSLAHLRILFKASVSLSLSSEFVL